jgi:hypothetical protein
MSRGRAFGCSGRRGELLDVQHGSTRMPTVVPGRRRRPEDLDQDQIEAHACCRWACGPWNEEIVTLDGLADAPSR